MVRLGKIIVRYVVSVLSCIYLLTLGIFSTRNRDLLYKVRIHLGLAKPSPISLVKPPPIIPCLDIDTILDTDLEIKVLGTEVAAGKDGRGIILWHDYNSPTWVDVTKGLPLRIEQLVAN